MPADYAVLASIYDKLSMGSFGTTMARRLLDYAQRSGWMGRNIMDAGSGSGDSMSWIARQGFMVQAVDKSPRMIELGKKALGDTGLNIRWLEQDLRSLSGVDNIDLALSLNVINELDSLRDLELIFQGVHRALRPGKLFIFDMYTIEGLLGRHAEGHSIAHEDRSLLIFQQTRFDYDRQSHTLRYIVLRRSDDLWQREETDYELRAYPVQAVASLLQRCGFTVNAVLNTALEKYVPGTAKSARVIFVAQQQS